MTLVWIMQDLVFEGPTPQKQRTNGFQVQKNLESSYVSLVNHQTSSTNLRHSMTFPMTLLLHKSPKSPGEGAETIGDSCEYGWDNPTITEALSLQPVDPPYPSEI